MLEVRKSTGIYELYHRGCNFPGTSRYIAPSADWCSVERMMPAIVMPIVSITAHLRTLCDLSHSRIAGLNSTSWTVRYVATCHATRNSTDCVPNPMIMG